MDERPSRAQRLPAWFRIRLDVNERFTRVRRLVRDGGLHTICESAGCPNRHECWNSGTATFLILGNLCSRRCTFCGVPKGRPAGIDNGEPERVAAAVAAMGICHAVITSVTRDDLPDGGAAVFADTIRALRSASPGTAVEVLIPDLQGSETALAVVLGSSPDIVNHNIETVPSLYPSVRPQASYERSLRLLERAKQRGFATKSGVMVGLSETVDELRSLFRDLRAAGCDILTIGQYLRPGPGCVPVRKFYHPDEFEALRNDALQSGFRSVLSGPLVRSSYHAAEAVFQGS
jgi:lipoic acid synthetase